MVPSGSQVSPRVAPNICAVELCCGWELEGGLKSRPAHLQGII